ncbi:type VI secretion system protein TssA [Arenibaculum pallidiluteum]|uniref:type VI secretion system protein TssA n=1 Tax=Arenibaculum pallidiluteum TaxID=2812559 RepID=UPI001A96E906|nr:type VI secretion system protein TssA [Arenibaculum pallidiluteum]
MDSSIDLSVLLAPAAGERSCGPDLRLDYAPTALYGRLKDLRMAARAAERRQETDGETDKLLPEWSQILVLAPEALSLSKDLEIGCWLAEALLRARGIDGLGEGFELLAGLVETYWPALYPAPDEEGLRTTLAPIAGLNGIGGEGTLLAPLRRVRVTRGRDGTSFAYWQVEQSAALSSIADPERRQRRIDAGVPAPEALQASARATPDAFFASLLAALDRCADAFGRLHAALDQRARDDAPPASAVRDLLSAMRAAVLGLGGPALAAAEADDAPGDPGDAGDPDGAGDPGGAARPAAAERRRAGPGGFASREEALQALDQVARYFRQAEPHSPISYTLDELVRRARMPFPDLLAELVPDEGTRRALLITAGINGALAERPLE